MKKSVQNEAPVEQAQPFTKEVQLRRKPGKKEPKATTLPTPTPEVVQPAVIVPPEPVVEVIAPVVITQEPPAPLTLESLQKAITFLREDMDKHTHLLEEIQVMLSKRRKPAANGNGKVQILDTKTQITYKSKNNVYQTLLRNDELTDLISQGVFGADPKKNSFGWYALNRAFPGRFVEVHPDTPEKA